MRFLLFVLFAILQSVALANELPFSVIYGALTQGSVALIQMPDEVSQAWLNDCPLIITNHRSVLGFGRDDQTVIFRWQTKQGQQSQQFLSLQLRNYDIQRINGLPNNKVNLDPQALAEIKRNNAEIATQRAKRDNHQLPQFPFAWPVAGQISSVYGSQRILNGQPRRPHFGVDIAAPEGTPVYAPADAKVLLVNPNMVLTGKTLLLDHGLGLKSIYIHLSEIDVKVGDQVSAGQMIGRVGKTGRATGPHLHWGVSWFDVQVDAARLVDTAKPPSLP